MTKVTKSMAEKYQPSVHKEYLPAFRRWVVDHKARPAVHLYQFLDVYVVATSRHSALLAFDNACIGFGTRFSKDDAYAMLAAVADPPVDQSEAAS